MKLFRILKIGKFWQHYEDEVIEEDDIFVGRVMTEERLRKGFETTLRKWDGSLDNLNYLFEHPTYDYNGEDVEEDSKGLYKIVFESVGVDL